MLNLASKTIVTITTKFFKDLAQRNFSLPFGDAMLQYNVIEILLNGCTAVTINTSGLHS